jgi:hypothetical protein
MEQYTVLQAVGVQGLQTLLHILEKGKEHALKNNLSEESLLHAKIAPDMFNFTKQIQVATDDIRRNVRLLAGKEHIPFEDNEKTFDELMARVKRTLDILHEIKSEDFVGADERKVSLSWMGGKYVQGKDFIKEFTFMNFLFHVVTAYDILRKEGVTIGKMDFITQLSMHDAD